MSVLVLGFCCYPFSRHFQASEVWFSSIQLILFLSLLRPYSASVFLRYFQSKHHTNSPLTLPPCITVQYTLHMVYCNTQWHQEIAKQTDVNIWLYHSCILHGTALLSVFITVRFYEKLTILPAQSWKFGDNRPTRSWDFSRQTNTQTHKAPYIDIDFIAMTIYYHCIMAVLSFAHSPSFAVSVFFRWVKINVFDSATYFHIGQLCYLPVVGDRDCRICVWSTLALTSSVQQGSTTAS